MKNLRVLIAESHDDTRALYADYLIFSGFDVIPAATTDEALAHIAEVDVVVTGIGVHGSVDGIGLVRQVRANPRTTALPTLVLTAYVLDSNRKLALSAGADAFLIKPCLPCDLARAIRRTLRCRRLPGRARPSRSPAAHSHRGRATA